MAQGTFKTSFSDAVLKPSGGGSDLELNGPAQTLDSDFSLPGKKFVIQVGEGQLKGVLKDLES
jgi:hypothetical protein